MFGSLILLLLSRPVSFVYAAIAVLAFLICAGRAKISELLATPWVKPMVAVSCGVLLFALWWFKFAEAPPNPDYIASAHLPHITNWGQRISYSLGNVSIFWAQMFGAVGTNEYSGPAWLTILWTCLSGGLVGAGVLFVRRRFAAVIIGLLAILLALPVVAQAYYLPKLYLTWMGRYDLPVFVGLVIFSAGALEARLARSEVDRLFFGGIALVGVLQITEFAGALRRYVVGLNGPINPFNWADGWHPPHIAALPLLCVGSAAIFIAYGAVFYLGRDGQPSPSILSDELRRR